MGDPGPRADATDVEPDAQPARRGHRRVRRQVDVLGDCRPREPVHAAARRHGGPANAPRLKGALCAGRRHWGPRRAPALVDRVVSLSPNCGTAAGTISRSRTTRPATLTVTVPRPDPDPPAPAPGVESDDEGLGADGAAAMARRPRPQDGAAWCRSRATWGERPGRSPRTSVPVPPAVAGERSGLAVGRLVEPGVYAAAAARRVRRPSPRPRGRARCRRAPARASRDDLQAEGLGQTARLARRPASRRGSRARRHRRSRRCAGRRVGGHGPRLRGQSVSPPPPAPTGTGAIAHSMISADRWRPGPAASTARGHLVELFFFGNYTSYVKTPKTVTTAYTPNRKHITAVPQTFK